MDPSPHTFPICPLPPSPEPLHQFRLTFLFWLLYPLLYGSRFSPFLIHLLHCCQDSRLSFCRWGNSLTTKARLCCHSQIRSLALPKTLPSLFDFWLSSMSQCYSLLPIGLTLPLSLFGPVKILPIPQGFSKFSKIVFHWCLCACVLSVYLGQLMKGAAHLPLTGIGLPLPWESFRWNIAGTSPVSTEEQWCEPYHSEVPSILSLDWSCQSYFC